MTNDPHVERSAGSDRGQEPAPHAGPDPAYGWDAPKEPKDSSGGRPASVGERLGALLLDGIGVAIVTIIVLNLMPFGDDLVSVGGGPSYLSRLILAIVGIAYFSLMEARSGQTLAKRMFGIRTVSADGSPVTPQAAAIRRLPFYAGILTPTVLGGLVGFVLLLAILITALQDEPAHRGIHDTWAGTKVVDADR